MEEGWPGWVDLDGWLYTDIGFWHRQLNPGLVTNPSTNCARCRVTLLIEKNVLQTANFRIQWVSVYGLTSHLTHYRSFWGRFLQARWPNQQCQSTEGNHLVVLRPTRTTPPCYNNTTLDNRLYTQRNGPNVTNPICWTCKNCSYKCAADCEHCVTQSSTELF